MMFSSTKKQILAYIAMRAYSKDMFWMNFPKRVLIVLFPILNCGLFLYFSFELVLQMSFNMVGRLRKNNGFRSHIDRFKELGSRVLQPIKTKCTVAMVKTPF